MYMIRTDTLHLPPLNKDAVTPQVLHGAPILSLIWKLDDIRILPLWASLPLFCSFNCQFGAL